MTARNFILRKTLPDSIERSRQIGRVVQELESLPHDASWRISIEQAKSERSLQQNKYLFGVAYALLSEATGYEKADLHTTLLGLHFGTRFKSVPKSRYNPEGLVEIPVRTTTTDEHGRRSVLGKQQFAEYVEFVRRWGADAGVVIPDPDPDYAQHEESTAGAKAA